MPITDTSTQKFFKSPYGDPKSPVNKFFRGLKTAVKATLKTFDNIHKSLKK